MSMADPKTPPGYSLEDVALLRARQAIRLVPAELPHLSGLVGLSRLKINRRTPVACVSSSGLVLVNPEVFARIPIADAAFVLAHEMMHLALDSFGRQGNSPLLLVNIAHDYIINDMLGAELGRTPPLDGLYREGAREESLEDLIARMKQNASGGDKSCWQAGEKGKPNRAGGGGFPLRRELQRAGLVPKDEPETTDPDLERGDMLPEPREDEFEPEITPELRRKLRERVRRAAAKAAGLGAMRKKMADASQGPDAQEPQRGETLMRAVERAYDTPWQRALQRWIDAVAPGERTYMRPSRRRSFASNAVLPGRKREGWTLHVLLDTSGSMVAILPQALGAIAYFAESAGVADVHIVQCDIEVTKDDWVEPQKLEEYKIRGFGYSEMAPGMNHLADDPEVQARWFSPTDISAIPPSSRRTASCGC